MAAPVLRCLLCRYVDGRMTWEIVSLQHWIAGREEFLAAGFWFVGLDPADECDITRSDQIERSHTIQRRKSHGS
jgi:hypothetical protein